VHSGAKHTRADLSVTLGDNSTVRDSIVSIVHPLRIPEKYRTWAASKMFLVGQDEEIEDLENLVSNQGPLADTELRDDVLASHSISGEGLGLLQQDRSVEFLESRQVTLKETLLVFLTRMCEGQFEDTPSLADLVFDEASQENADDDAGS
jgi:hypothetical protein